MQEKTSVHVCQSMKPGFLKLDLTTSTYVDMLARATEQKEKTEFSKLIQFSSAETEKNRSYWGAW